MKHLLHLIAIYIIGIIIITNVSAQTSVSSLSSIRSELNAMFANLDKDRIPTGLLLDYAIDTIDLSDYDGSNLTDSTYVDRVILGDILNTLNSASVDGDIFDTAMLIDSFESQPSDYISIATVLYQYNYIKEDAIDNNLISYDDNTGQVSDVFQGTEWQNPYDSSYVFAFAPNQDIYYSMDVTYEIANDFFFNNVSNINALYFDAGDDLGYRVMDSQAVHVLYSEEGLKTIKIKVELEGGLILEAHSKIIILCTTSLSEFGASFPAEPEVCSHTLSDGTEIYANISYWTQSVDGKLRNPFIVVEGFDPWQLARIINDNIYAGQKVPQGFTYCTSAENWNNTYESALYGSFIQSEMSSYDLVYIDWSNSLVSIQDNAELLIKCIQRINEIKADAGSTSKNVLMGQSMGGLIARYALKRMESLEIKHEVSTYVSHDAPHLGANVPVGFFYLIQYLMSYTANNKTLVNVGSLHGHGRIIKPLTILYDIIFSKSVQQMLYNYVDSSGNIYNVTHSMWQYQLKNMGFPQGDAGETIECLSIVNGGYHDYISDYVDYKHYLNFDGEIKVSFLSKLLLCLADYITLGAVRMSSIALSLFLNLPVAAYINPILSSSRLKVKIQVNPTFTNLGYISRMNVEYTKKFLWIFPKTYILFNAGKGVPYSSLCYEDFPGSLYKISDDEVNQSAEGVLGGYSILFDVADNIMFIPTASALCVNEGQTTEDDYYRNYYQIPPIPKEEIPFDAYYLERNATRHIYTNSAMFDWLHSQMNMTICGPNFIYPNGCANFTTTEHSEYVTWSTSDTRIATIDSSGILTANDNGIVTVIAEFRDGGKLYRKTKDVSVGFPDFVITKSFEVGLGYKFVATATNGDFQSDLNQIVDDGTLQYEWSVIDSERNMTTYLSSNNYLVYLPDVDEAVTVCVRLVKTGTENKSAVKSTSFNLQTLFDLNYDYAAIGADGFAYLVNIEQNTLDGEAQETAVRFNYGTKLRISLKNVSLDSTTNSNTTESLTEMLNTYIKGNVCYLKYGDAWMSNYLTGTKVSLYNKWDFDFFDHDIFLDEVAEVVSEANGEDRVLATIPLIICNSEYENLQFVPFHIVYKSSIGQD